MQRIYQHVHAASLLALSQFDIASRGPPSCHATASVCARPLRRSVAAFRSLRAACGASSLSANRRGFSTTAPLRKSARSMHRRNSTTSTTQQFPPQELMQGGTPPPAAEHQGIFQSQHIKPFPVRAAIDIGTGGVISLSIGRVDARVEAVQKLLHQTQLPLYLEKLSHTSQSTATFTLSERTVDDIKMKMRVLHGAMKRNAFEGLSERAAVLSWPLCCATNAQALADELTRTFQVDVRVLGAGFNVEWPLSMRLHSPAGSSSSSSAVNRQVKESRSADHAKSSSAAAAGGNRLKQLLRNASIATDESANTNTGANTTTSKTATDDPAALSAQLQAQVDALAFLAHAAVSQCVAPQRLLVLNEDPQRGVRLCGLDTTPAAEVADLLAAADSPEAVAKLKTIAFGGADATAHGATATADAGGDGSLAAAEGVVSVVASQEGLRVIEHALPVDVATAHRYCITHIQRRPIESYGLHTSSPNPLLAEEFAALRGLLTETLRHDLPLWAMRKSQLGGMVVATSHNGGLFNIAARVAQQTSVSLDHLEVHAEHHFCGLTDVLLADTFPNPLTVLPSAALAAALLRALASPRLQYVPELNIAAALLVQPSLWLASRADVVRRRLSADPFHAAQTRAQRGRVFARPHRKDNPTAAPDATWVHGEAWNPLSYEQSVKGT